ncbi:MAG: NTP transferase domain-containing protein [Erysipelotrichaceae bacterium]
MSYVVDNAIIMAAGLSSRFVPISYEKPKALVKVKGEILIERQIKQLKEAGITDITIVTGYKQEAFAYLKDKFDVKLVENKEYQTRNNHASLYVVKDQLKNSYICSADNYFKENPFTKENEESYYASVFVKGKTNEWCMQINEDDYIEKVEIGGRDAWVMLGHVFFSNKFSENLIRLIEKEYDEPETKDKLWEQIYIDHINQLPMKIKRYDASFIYEFDSLDELRCFDSWYCNHSDSKVIRQLCLKLNCEEKAIVNILPVKDISGQTCGMNFNVDKQMYYYDFEKGELHGISK